MYVSIEEILHKMLKQNSAVNSEFCKKNTKNKKYKVRKILVLENFSCATNRFVPNDNRQWRTEECKLYILEKNKILIFLL